MYSLIVTAKLNNIDPRAWLADVLAHIADHPASQLNELLPWHWARQMERRKLNTVHFEILIVALKSIRRVGSGVRGRSG